jgi:RNA polymerase sigma factor (TIGR02999 family)
VAIQRIATDLETSMTSPHASTVTRVLAELGAGDPSALDRLLPLVYDELRVIAASQLRREASGHTLEPTALVHEAFLRLVDQREGFRNRGHFFGVAAQAMRRILVDYARRRRAQKRDGGVRITLSESVGPDTGATEQVLAVDEALQRLEAMDPRLARVVELRFFAGLSVEETGDALDISPATVKRDWSAARAWLQRELGDQ